ncbi:UBC-like protein [Lojkania enalia]|uniref:UBC-like protein n=1 Tax=Lojkania enalia TaxID=147567 RepID=A0A9P4N1U3_9PLEO|nr:UBC-like protein [Didymosphaeria enalia]
MPLPDSLPTLLSFRKQRLLVEFASLRAAHLDGVFVSITPGDPTLWVGVVFVRKGPYAPAILRFQISFPPSYPTLPPLVTFSTDVFHPLLTPLTTYTYTTGSSDTDTVSATDEERLPPGGFSLRHGFPQWFGRARRSAPSSRNVSGSGTASPARSQTPVLLESKDVPTGISEPNISPVTSKDASIINVLEYIRSTFSDEAVLDSVPLEAAANPGAYHAWRTYRAGSLQSQRSPSPSSPISDSQASATGRVPEGSALGRNRRPGEWNWEGVWEERVKKAVRASLSEPVLFGGGTAGEDIIRFRDSDGEGMEKMKSQLQDAVSRLAEA